MATREIVKPNNALGTRIARKLFMAGTVIDALAFGLLFLNAIIGIASQPAPLFIVALILPTILFFMCILGAWALQMQIASHRFWAGITLASLNISIGLYLSFALGDKILIAPFALCTALQLFFPLSHFVSPKHA